MSKTTDAIQEAARKGYRADASGNISNPAGLPIKPYLTGRKFRRYLTFSVRLGDESLKVPIHKFVAFLKFGQPAIYPGVHTRHVNDDPRDNRWENIDIGTNSDNMLDRPAITRRLHASAAGRANSMPQSVWDSVEIDRIKGACYREIGEKYGIAKSTLSFRLSRKAKRQIMRDGTDENAN